MNKDKPKGNSNNTKGVVYKSNKLSVSNTSINMSGNGTALFQQSLCSKQGDGGLRYGFQINKGENIIIFLQTRTKFKILKEDCSAFVFNFDYKNWNTREAGTDSEKTKVEGFDNFDRKEVIYIIHYPIENKVKLLRESNVVLEQSLPESMRG